MTTSEFFIEVLLPHFTFYLGLSVIFLSTFYILMRRSIIGIFDPFILIMLTAALDNAAIGILWIAGLVVDQVLLSVWLSSFAFFIMFKIGLGYSRPNARSERHFPTDTIIFVIITTVLIKYWLWGIPLFNEESRLGGFFGESRISYSAITMMVDTLFVACMAAAYFDRESQMGRARLWMVALLFFVDGVLSGSKSGSVLAIAGVWQICQIIEAKRQGGLIKKITLSIYIAFGIVFSVGFIVASILRYGVSSVDEVGLLLGLRLMQTSDIFYFSVENGFLHSVGEGIVGFFEVALPTVSSLFSGNRADQSYGQQMHYFANNFDSLEAPNARLIALASSSLGLAAPLVTGMIGWTVGLIRRRAAYSGSPYWVPIFLLAPAIFIDVPYTIGRAKWALLALAFVYFCQSLVQKSLNSSKARNVPRCNETYDSKA